MLWDGAKIQSEPLPTVDYDSYMNTESGLREALYNLLKYGVTIVKGVRLTSKEECSRVGLLSINYFFARVRCSNSALNHFHVLSGCVNLYNCV